HCLLILLAVSLSSARPLSLPQSQATDRPGAAKSSQGPPARQLFAVRGEVVKVKAQSKGMLLITVKPAREFGEVTVLARENDLVGHATGRGGEVDIFGLLSGDSSEDETITA